MRIILGSSPSLRHLCLATRRESVLRGDGRRAEYHHISSCQNLDSRPRGSLELFTSSSLFLTFQIATLFWTWSVARRNGCGF